MTSAPGAACRPLTNTPSTTENPLFLHIGHKRLTCALESASAMRRLNSMPAVTGGIGVCRVSLMTWASWGNNCWRRCPSHWGISANL